MKTLLLIVILLQCIMQSVMLVDISEKVDDIWDNFYSPFRSWTMGPRCAPGPMSHLAAWPPSPHCAPRPRCASRCPAHLGGGAQVPDCWGL